MISAWRRISKRDGEAMRASSSSVLKRHFWASSLVASFSRACMAGSAFMSSAFFAIVSVTTGTAAEAAKTAEQMLAARRLGTNFILILLISDAGGRGAGRLCGLRPACSPHLDGRV